jgi:hypothetical protein
MLLPDCLQRLKNRHMLFLINDVLQYNFQNRLIYRDLLLLINILETGVTGTISWQERTAYASNSLSDKLWFQQNDFQNQKTNSLK